MIAEVLGIDGDAAAKFRAAAADLMPIDPSDPASNAVRVPAMTTIVMVLLEVIAGKRASPAEDVISEWIAARDLADRSTEEELTSLAFLVSLPVSRTAFIRSRMLLQCCLSEIARSARRSRRRRAMAKPCPTVDL
ncbi:hypothetical protein ACNJ7E_02785 [Rhodococcus sp. NM-2]|uniref:hypothetical protein n=1 Tax=Rhodococcus sp. NM-2 TaxID=3401174 RepID=UPI003AADBACA